MKIDNGEILTNNSAYISVGSLLAGHRMEYTTYGSIINPGETSNVLTTVTIYDQYDNDVTANYEIIKENGVLKIIDPEA